MEGYITGDLVLCIGQSAVLVGREVKYLNGATSIFQDNVAPIFVYVDDFGISDDLVKKSDYCYRFPKRCSTYFEGFDCGHALVEYVLNILESSDTCERMSILFSADEGLGSGVAAFMAQYAANYLPGFVVLTVGILPHLSQGGLSCVNTCLAMQQCLQYASCCMLRRMDDTSHSLCSSGARNKAAAASTAKGGHRASAFAEVARCMAADILLAIRETDWLVSLCHSGNKLVDVRSSLWQLALNPSCASLRSGSSSGNKLAGGGAESTHHQSLRLLGTNLHSLHLSTTPFASTPRPSSDASHTFNATSALSCTSGSSATSTSMSTSSATSREGDIASISRASLLSISKASPTTCSFSDVDLQSSAAQTAVLPVLRGSTPRVRWPQGLSSQHRLHPTAHMLPLPSGRLAATAATAAGSAGPGLAHLTAVCFCSPYAASLLKQAADRAGLMSHAGAYDYWLNKEYLVSPIVAASGHPNQYSGRAEEVTASQQIKFSLFFIQDYLHNLYL